MSLNQILVILASATARSTASYTFTRTAGHQNAEHEQHNAFRSEGLVAHCIQAFGLLRTMPHQRPGKSSPRCVACRKDGDSTKAALVQFALEAHCMQSPSQSSCRTGPVCALLFKARRCAWIVANPSDTIPSNCEAETKDDSSLRVYMQCCRFSYPNQNRRQEVGIRTSRPSSFNLCLTSRTVYSPRWNCSTISARKRCPSRD